MKHCRWVDEVICPCPWIVTMDFLRQHNIHYVAHDEIPYNSAGAEDIYAEVKKQVKYIYKHHLGNVQSYLKNRWYLYLRYYP